MAEDETPNNNPTEGQGTDKPISSLAPDMDRAIEIVKMQQEANAKKEELLNREEALMARKALGGNSEAGQTAPEPTPETDEEFTERAMNGEVDFTK